MPRKKNNTRLVSKNKKYNKGLSSNQKANKSKRVKKRNLKSSRMQKRMQQLGLVMPLSGRVDVIKLRNKWYAKLAAEGFKDLEWYDPLTGKGQASDIMHKPLHVLSRKYKPETEFYYAILRNFITWCSESLDEHTAFIMHHFAEGVSYRKIVVLFNARFPNKKRSLFYIFSRIKATLPLVKTFNEQHPEGLSVHWPDFEQH